MRNLPLVQSKVILFIAAIFLAACSSQPENVVDQESGASSDSNQEATVAISEPTTTSIATQEITPTEAPDRVGTPPPPAQKPSPTGESADDPESDPEPVK